ncbi:MAG: hypothetical protein AcusKO_45430 [Acuticoccus sp.]
MNAERLLALYENAAEAPDAIARLRRFVLDLAVRGKLVAQDPADEPASALLKRVAAAKAQLVKAGKIRRPRELVSVDELASPFDVPATWLWCRLDTVGAITGGGTPSANDPDNFTEPGEGFPWLTPADLGGHRGLTVERGSRDLTEKGLTSSSATMMPAGTVLFTSRAPIGYVAIAANPISTNQGFKSIVPYIADCSRYVALAMRTFAPDIDAKAPGTTFKEVSGKIVAGIPFPLPPLAEQGRIVAKVDELMGLLDRLEAVRQTREATRDRLTAATLARLTAPDTNAKRPATPKPAADDTDPAATPANPTPWTFPKAARFALDALPALTTRPDQIKPLRQTTLNLAVGGKLVAQDPADEPACEGLRELFHHKQNQIAAGKLRKTSDPEIAAPPEALPDSWVWVRPEEVSATIPNALTIGPFGSNLVKADYRSEGVPLTFVADVTSGFKIPIKKYVSENKAEQLSSHAVRGGDLVITKMGDPPGTPAIYPTKRPDGIITADCLKWSLAAQLIDIRFACHAVASDLVHSQIVEITKGGAHQKISLKRFRSIFFPLPPLAEQHRIVAKVDALMALCDRLEAALTTTDTTRARLLESLLHEALSPATDAAVREAAK